jgi:hypothetical protein
LSLDSLLTTAICRVGWIATPAGNEPTVTRPSIRGLSGSGLITNTAALVVPPPGGGVVTVIWASPIWLRSVDEITACSSTELTNVVWRDSPLNCTTEVGLNSVPSTVMFSSWFPENADDGYMKFSAGDSDGTTPPAWKSWLSTFSVASSTVRSAGTNWAPSRLATTV